MTVLTSSSLTRLSAGKVGFRVAKSYAGYSGWDDLTCIKTGADQIASYDDYYPYGQVIEGRSYNAGLSDTRFKYTEKERDQETGYDYFGARYYDSRIGRWMSVDPLAEKYASLSPFVYAGNEPLGHFDIDGRDFFPARLVRENPRVQEALSNFRSTALGAAVWDRINADHGIVVVLRMKTWDNNLAAGTNWQTGYQNLTDWPITEDETIQPAGRIAITVDLNTNFLNDDLEGTLFDELFSHIHFERYKLKNTEFEYQGFERTSDDDHKVLGKEYGWPAKPGYPYDEFEKQLTRVKAENKKRRGNSSMRRARSTDSARNPRFIDPLTGEEYVVD